MDRLTKVPLPPKMSLDLLPRMVSRDYFENNLPVELDECLLSLCLQAWNKGTPIHRFPAAMLRLLPHPRSVRWPSYYHPNSRLCRRPDVTDLNSAKPTRSRYHRNRNHLNRCTQFMYEAQKASTVEMVVYKAIGHRLPAELIEHVIDMFVAQTEFPRSATFNKIWAPRPQSQTSDDSSRSRRSRYCGCEVHWLPEDKKFVPSGE
jgi:hypothetical protein